MSRTLLLGKHGDILSVLPCLHAEFKETGVKPSLIVAKEYAALPKSLPWLSVEEFPGTFERIGEAIKWAKQRGQIDYLPQMSGVGYPSPVRKHPSFQYDQWDRMGRLHQWQELGLELPRLTPATMGIATPKDWGRKYILIADHSQSSPFAHIEDLHDSLTKSFPDYQIARLSALRLPNLLYGLVALDDASLIVTIDTAWLHLSRAVKTPVIALVTDHPSTWHGSAWHPRFAMHCRYADYELRKSELLWTAKEILT